MIINYLSSTSTYENSKMSVADAVSIKVFQLFCIMLAFYMTYEQFLLYSKNEDSSSVSYRKFNQEEKDMYPSISVCLHSTKGAILMETDEPGDTNLNEDALTVDEYHKMLVGHEELRNGFNTINFDHMAVDIVNQFIDVSVSYTKQGNEFNPWNRASNNSTMSPFYKSYHDPYFLCITKTLKFVKHQILHYDYLVLNSQKLYHYVSKFDNHTNLFLHVHHPGQLVREFGKQTFQLNRLDFQNAINGTGNYREIHISDLEMVRKRFDGVDPCNDTLENEDHYWLKNVINDVNCVPSFWKEIYLSSQMYQENVSSINSNVPDCNSSIQYANIHKNYLPPNNFDRVTRLYNEPCNRMRLTLNILQKDKKNLNNALILAFNYNIEEYRETLNHRAFGKLWVMFVQK